MVALEPCENGNFHRLGAQKGLSRSPDGGAKRRNPGPCFPDSAALHPGYFAGFQLSPE
jgi:hypothetical protein